MNILSTNSESDTDSDKEYVFWLHYNQPESRKRKKPMMTVHYRNKCHFVENIMCETITFGHLKEEQPRWVIKGKSNMFEIINNVAIIKNNNDTICNNSGSTQFSFSYNKGESNRNGKPQISLFFRNELHIVDNIFCDVYTYSEIKKMQFTLNGVCKLIEIIDKIAYIK